MRGGEERKHPEKKSQRTLIQKAWIKAAVCLLATIHQLGCQPDWVERSRKLVPHTHLGEGERVQRSLAMSQRTRVTGSLRVSPARHNGLGFRRRESGRTGKLMITVWLIHLSPMFPMTFTPECKVPQPLNVGLCRHRRLFRFLAWESGHIPPTSQYAPPSPLDSDYLDWAATISLTFPSCKRPLWDTISPW